MTPALPARSPVLRRLRGLAALLLAGVIGAGSLPAQRMKEYDLKAVFLFNFTTFVEWPAIAHPGEGEPFVIGILGEDPFGPVLDQVVNGETVKGSPLRIVRGQKLEDLPQARILFVSASESTRLPAILAALRGRPVLTVGDNPRFLDAGGMVGFSTGAHVQLHINPDAARASGLTISSKLLRVAKVRGVPAP